MKRSQAETLLKKTFNLANFYDEQWETISKILNGERVLLIEKTRFGNPSVTNFLQQPLMVLSLYSLR